jgi:transcriptional regulator GlxA family with amidase domain
MQRTRVMKIVIVASEGCLASAIVGLVDILWLAQRAISDGGKAVASFKVVTASVDGAPVTDGRGRRLEVDKAFGSIRSCDAIIVPGFVPDGTRRPPSMSALAPAAAWIRHHHTRGALACGSCSGVFLLGEAGLLDGRRCTTTWWLHDEMKHRFPRAQATFGAALIEDRRVVSAGGPLSWIDLALHTIRMLCGADAARVAADYAVVDTAPSTQAVYVPAGHLARSDAFLMDAERIVRHAGEASLSARDLAHRLSTSERTLHRRLKLASGESPKTFIDRVRFETAKTALEDSTRSVKQVAAAAGYTDETSFRRAFRRLSGMTPGAYRTWARARLDPSSHNKAGPGLTER